jgi:hypothetical protein
MYSDTTQRRWRSPSGTTRDGNSSRIERTKRSSYRTSLRRMSTRAAPAASSVSSSR